MHWDQLRSRTKFLVKRKFFGMGTSMIFDEEGRELLVYAKARYFQWHGFKLFGDKEMTQELSFAKRDLEGKGIIGKVFNAEYNVTDTMTGQPVGKFRRKGWTSILRDTWEIYSPDGTVIGEIKEPSGGRAFLSRIFPLFFPQRYTFTIDGREAAFMKGKFAFFAPKYELTLLDQTADIRLILNGAALIGGVEGSEGSHS
ncbi:MAG: hypothetical protein A2Y33_12725 [Spirochaetes bacterium GWF1_51_8]|nr:MAG: hypothetical protein A2Y33_12725 [Spirochaetes bacterium GWF1_51_8]